MNLELKSIKYRAYASRATFCYDAVLHVDGKPFALVGNGGQGAADYQRPVCTSVGTPADSYLLAAEFHARLKEINDWLASREGPGSLEAWCTDQIADFAARRELKAATRHFVAWVMPNGQVYRRKKMPARIAEQIAATRESYPDAVVLNDMPEADALTLWKSLA